MTHFGSGKPAWITTDRQYHGWRAIRIRLTEVQGMYKIKAQNENNSEEKLQLYIYMWIMAINSVRTANSRDPMKSDTGTDVQ